MSPALAGESCSFVRVGERCQEHEQLTVTDDGAGGPRIVCLSHCAYIEEQRRRRRLGWAA